MWLLENLKLHMRLTFVACIVFLLDSTGLGHFLQVLELHVLYLVIICSFPHIQVFDLNMPPTFLSSTTPTRKLESALFYLLALHSWGDNEFCFRFNFSPFGVVMGGVVFLFVPFFFEVGWEVGIMSAIVIRNWKIFDYWAQCDVESAVDSWVAEEPAHPAKPCQRWRGWEPGLTQRAVGNSVCCSMCTILTYSVCEIAYVFITYISPLIECKLHEGRDFIFVLAVVFWLIYLSQCLKCK